MRTRLPRRSRRVFLTFDDGPDPLWTPKVLDELARLGVRATFFVVGERAAGRLDLLQRMRAEGHEVGLHCMRHVRHTVQTRAEVERDTDEALAVLDAAGVRPAWWRLPFNTADTWTAAIASERGLRIVGVSADPRDWTGDAPGAMLVDLAPDLLADRVIVLHDGLDQAAPRRDASNTVAVLDPLVAELRARRLRPALLGDGDAIWRVRRVRPDLADRVEILEEKRIGSEDHAAIRALLAASMPRATHEYATRGWRRVPPQLRVVARDAAGRVVATASVVVARNDHGLLVDCIADVAVAGALRGDGLGRTLVRAAAREARERGCDAILADTTAFAGVLATEGWRRVPRFAIFYERHGACHWHPQWWVWERESLPQRLRLDDGDL